MENNSNSKCQSDNNSESSKGVTANLAEIRAQVSACGTLIDKIVDELQNVPTGSSVDAFKTQVLRKQAYLENLIDETSCEVDLLKRDMSAMAADLDEIKATLWDMQPPYIQSKLETTEDDEQAIIAALRCHPLSSIPPRKLSENEAMSFLKAIDDIVTQRRISDLPGPVASSE